MKCVLLKKYGDIDNLSVEDLPAPTLGPDQIAIAVKAVGVNFGDILIRQGFHKESPPPPAVHGSEVAGVIDAIGPELLGQTAFKVGDRVMAYLPRYGGYAERVVCSPDYVAPIPAQFSFTEGAAFPVNFMTAYILARKLSNVAKGEKALLHSAGGCVGLALLQLCKLQGAQTYCVASPSKHEGLKRMGADHCLTNDLDSLSAVQEVIAAGGFDVIFDSLGGSSFRKSYAMLAPLGRLCMFGASSFITDHHQNWMRALGNFLKFPLFTPLQMINRSRSVCGFGILQVPEGNHVLRAALIECAQLWQSGQVGPVIDKTFPLEKLGEAQRYLEERRNFGKVVLTL